MMSQHVRLLLCSLGHPKADSSFSVADGPVFRGLVFELEDKWIRAQSAGSRGPLKALATAEWNKVFAQYLTEVDCPLAYRQEQNEEDVLEWLLHLAVAYAYEDNCAKRAGGEIINSSSVRKANVPEIQFTDWNAPDTQDLLQQLLRKLHIQTSSTLPAEQLMVAKAMIEDQIVPAVEDIKLGRQTCSAAKNISALDTHKDTLGFTTNDDQVDAAATMMRMLFIKDLRRLQDEIDEAIVAVQNFTQNPTTNAKLGLVGW